MTETFTQDVESIITAMREGGQDAANAQFNKLVKERKLALWEVGALKTIAVDRMRERGLLPK